MARRGGAQIHVPVLRRLPRPDWRRMLEGDGSWWLYVGGGILAVLTIATIIDPDRGVGQERVSSLLALIFFISAVAAWFGMRARGVWVGIVGAAVLYLASAFTTLFDVEDLFLISILVGLLLFVLAGFNLLFILEELIYDAHRMLQFRSRAWSALPAVVVVAIVVGGPFVEHFLGPELSALRVTAIGCLVLLAVAWTLRLTTSIGFALIRDVDLLVAGALAGGALAEAVGLLRAAGGLAPAIIAYVSMFGTWLYISATTLHRAQYFLRARDTVPWIGLLLSTGFAVLAHVHQQFRASGASAISDIINVRVGYMLLGIWLGIAFFAIRGLWRIFLFIRDAREVPRSTRQVAGALARFSEEFLGTEERLERATLRILASADRGLPGTRRPPSAPAHSHGAPGRPRPAAVPPADSEE